MNFLCGDCLVDSIHDNGGQSDSLTVIINVPLLGNRISHEIFYFSYLSYCFAFFYRHFGFGFWMSGYSSFRSLFILGLAFDIIFRLSQKIPVDKAIGLDNISIYLLKEAAPNIESSLTARIINIDYYMLRA